MTKEERMQQVFNTVDKLSAIVKNIQQCLQCTICLHMISDPMRTPCGHQFCRTCIQTVVQKKNAHCPLCNKPLHRRSIAVDESMVEYINKLQNLIRAIQKDSGVDLMSHLARTYSRQKTEPPKSIGIEEMPSCSYVKSSVKGQLDIRSNQQDRLRNVSKDPQRKTEQTDSIKKYLSNRDVSSVEFASEKSTNYYCGEASREGKVQTWLKSLPDTEILVTEHYRTEDSVNAFQIAVTPILGDNKVEAFDMDDIETVIIDKTSSNVQETDRNESDDKEDYGKPEIGEFTKYLTDNFDAESPKPSSSGIKKSHDAEKRNQEVHRTSLKDNWTSVVELGNKMRTKKKKFKALNVSIENVRPRSLDDSKKTETARSKERNNPKQAKGNRSDTFEDKPTIIFQEKERSAKEQSVVPDESPCKKSENTSIEGNDQYNASFITLEGKRMHIKNLNDYQMTDIIGIAPPDEQITLHSSSDTIIINREDQILSDEEYNERVISPSILDETHIAQIISKTPSSSTNESLSLKRFANKLSESPGVDVDSPLQTVKSDLSRQIDQNEENINAKKRFIGAKLRESSVANIDSPLQTVKSDLIRQIDQNEGRTNAMKRFIETKLRDVPVANIDSPLQTVKSDLSCQINKDEGNTNGKKRSIETKLREFLATNVDSPLQTVNSDLNHKTDQNIEKTTTKKNMAHIIEEACPLETKEKNRKLITNPVVPSKALTKEALKQNKKNRPMVMFKKLGKTFKQSKRKIKYLYLGSTKREATIRCVYGIDRVWKDYICNNVETVQLDTEMCTTTINSIEGFGKKISVTVNDTPIEEVENIAVVKKTKNEQSKESVKSTEPCTLKESSNVPGRSTDSNVPGKSTDSNVPGKSTDSNVLLISLDVNEETKEAQKTTSPTTVRMFSPMDDSQLQFLSLGSPMNEHDNLKTNNPYNLSGTPKKCRIQSEEERVCSSSSSSIRPTISCHRKRKRVNSLETSPEISKQNSKISEEAMSAFRNKIPAMKNDNNDSALIAGKKQYRRILPLASDSDSPSIAPKLLSNQSSSSNKRKRDVLSDSDNELDLSVIENWCPTAPNDKYKEKREISEVTKASCEAKDKSSSTNCNKTSSELTTLPRKLADFGANHSNKKCNSNGSQGKIEFVLDEESPDFGSMIDKVKDIKNKAVSNENTDQCFMQDNFDEVFANVNTADFIVDEEMYEEMNKENELICKKRKSSVVCPRVLEYHSENNSSDKENNFMMTADEIKKSKENTIEENVNPVASTSTSLIKIRANKSANQNLDESNEVVKDSFEEDSFVNVTKDYLMLQQFEEDLLGKSLSSKLTFGWQLSTPKKLKNSQISSTNQKDVVHVVEDEDDGDIIESTPETKTKNMQLVHSQQEIVMGTPTTTVPRFPNSPSTAGKSSSNFSTPSSTKIQPLCQSTPKTPPSTNSTSFLRRLKFRTTRLTDKSPKNEVSVESNPNDRRQGLCFTCSGLIPSQIENVKRLAQFVNASYVSQFERKVTHVVVKTDENNGANKTLKYLQGIANRKWIVSYQWVIDSIMKKRLIDEEQYEAVDYRTLEAGPRRSRLGDTDLFKQFVFLCVGPYIDITVEQYKDLLRATGASVVDSLNALTAETKLKIIVVQAERYGSAIIVKWYKETKAISIDHEWIFECISQYKLISLYPYLQELSRPDALALGYPEYLLQEDPDRDSASTNEDTTDSRLT